jgi:hypothetical protein
MKQQQHEDQQRQPQPQRQPQLRTSRGGVRHALKFTTNEATDKRLEYINGALTRLMDGREVCLSVIVRRSLELYQYHLEDALQGDDTNQSAELGALFKHARR